MKKELTITLKVDAKTGQVNAVKNSFDDLDRKVSQTNNNTSNFKSTLLGLAGATVVIMGISKAFELAIGQAESFLDTGSKFEQYKNGLSSFYVGQDKLNEALELGRKFSDDYNVSIDETFKSMHLMKVYGIDATADSLEKYGNIAKGSMKSIEQFVEAMADAFMGENERLKEFGVKASVQGKKVAYSWTDSSGKARSVVIDNNRKMIESTLLTIYNEKYVGQMAKYASSWSGFIQGIKTDYENFQIDVMNEGLLTHIEAVAESFATQWKKSFGDSKETAKEFSVYMSEKVDSMAMGVAFLIDTWSGINLVWSTLKVGFYGLVYFISELISEISYQWDNLGVTMHNLWKSTVDGMGSAFYGFANFFIETINKLTSSIMGLGNDFLSLVGIDPISPLNVSLLEYKSSMVEATKNTRELTNSWSNGKLVESLSEVSKGYEELQNNSAQSFTEKALARMTESTKKVIKAKKEDITKTKEAKDAMDELLKKYSGKLPESIKKGSVAQKAQNKILKEAKQLERERAKEAKAVSKAWEDTYKSQNKAFEDYTKNKNEAYKEYLRIMGDYQRLAKIENSEKVLELKPYLSKDKIAQVSAQLEDLSKLPSFKDGIADAFGVNTNASLAENISQLKYDLGGIASDLFVGLLKDYQETGDINQSIQSMTDSNALGNAFMSSGNPYLMATSVVASVIGNMLSEPMDAFQAMETNIGATNTAIADSTQLLANTAYPQLEHTKAMRNHLKNMDENFRGIAISLASSGQYDYSGANVDTKIKYNSLGSELGNVVDDIPVLGEIAGGLVRSLFGSSSSSVEHAGLSFNDQSVESLMNNGADVQSYTDIKNTSSSLFGLVRSTSYSTQFGDVDQGLKDRFAESLSYGYRAILEAGTALGLDQDLLDEAIRNSTVSLGKFDFKDKTQEEISTILSGVFSTQLSNISADVVPFVEDFKGLNEEYFTALTRVASGYEEAIFQAQRLSLDVVNINDVIDKQGDVALEALRTTLLQQEGIVLTHVTDTVTTTLDSLVEDTSRLGTQLTTVTSTVTEQIDRLVVDNSALSNIGEIIQGFNGSADGLVEFYESILNLDYRLQETTSSTISLSQSMLDVVGGADNLTRLNNSYIQNFFTDEEQARLALGSLNREFQQLGATVPTTRSVYRDWLESITDPKLYAQALELQGGVTSFFDSLDKQTASLESEKEKIISDNQAIVDSLEALRISVKNNFLGIFTDTLIEAKTSFYDDVANQNYDNILNSYGVLTTNVQNSNLTDREKFIELARANDLVRNIQDPTADTSSISERILELTDVTSRIEELTRDIKQSPKEAWEQATGETSPLYGVISKGLTTEQFVAKTDETTNAWRGYQNSLDVFNLGITNKTTTNQNSIEALKKEMIEMKQEQQKTNALNQQIINGLQQQLSALNSISTNTEEPVIKDGTWS